MYKRFFIISNIIVLIGAICLLIFAKSEAQFVIAFILTLPPAAALWRHEMYLKK